MLLLALSLPVALFTELLLFSIAFLIFFGHPLADLNAMLVPLLLLLFLIYLAKLCESLYHAMYLLLLLVHKHLLEWPLSGQLQVLKEISLPAGVHSRAIIKDLDLLL